MIQKYTKFINYLNNNSAWLTATKSITCENKLQINRGWWNKNTLVNSFFSEDFIEFLNYFRDINWFIWYSSTRTVESHIFVRIIVVMIEEIIFLDKNCQILARYTMRWIYGRFPLHCHRRHQVTPTPDRKDRSIWQYIWNCRCPTQPICSACGVISLWIYCSAPVEDRWCWTWTSSEKLSCFLWRTQ